MMRRHLLAAHKWVGICLGAFWLLQALTGLVLAYTPVLDTAAYAPRPAKPVAPDDFSRAALVARAGHPDDTITRLMLPQQDSSLIDAYIVAGSGETTRLRILRQDERVLAEESWSEVRSDTPALRLVYRWHYDLLGRPAGHVMVGVSGLFLMISAGLGIALSWPKGRKWKAILKPIPWKRSLPACYSWHRALGLWSCLGLCVIASTGSALVWLPQIRLATGLTVSEPAASGIAPADVPAVDIRQAAALAMQAVPEGSLYLVDMPDQQHARFRIRLREPGDPRELFGTTTVYVSADGDRLLGVLHRSDQSAGHQLLDAVYALHTGEIGGPGGKILVFATGLVMVALCVLGYALWFRKKFAKRKKS